MTVVGRTPDRGPVTARRSATPQRPAPRPHAASRDTAAGTLAAVRPRAAARERAAARAVPESRFPVSAVTLIASVGVLVASAAYAAGRMGYASSPWADRAYWLGQALVVAPVAQRLLSRRRLSRRGAGTLVVVLTVAEYLLKVCYSPLSFTFTDELLHLRSTVDVLQTGKLFTVNYGLPISPRYPGLEEATSALVSVTGMPVFVGGLIVAGVAHLLFICLLYLAFWCFSRSYRVAGIAALAYNCTPTLDSFDAMFVYETLALAFLGLAVLAAWRTVTEKSGADRARWFILAVLAIFATVVTHHVTSYMLVGSLFLVAFASLLTRTWRTTLKVGALAVISAAAVACWVIYVAPSTVSYFRPTLEGIAQGLDSLQSGSSSGAPSTSAAPLGNQVLEGLAVLIITALLPLGWWQVWRRHRSHPWIVAMAIGSLGWFAALALRVGTPDGQELAGRTATFVYIPVSLVIGLSLIRLVNAGLARRWESVTIAVAVAGTLTLLFDGLSNGWPPYWERLPGPHQVAGFERSVGPEEIATAQWTLTALGPGHRFASDIGSYPLLIGYGDQNPLQGTGYLYTARTFTPAIARQAKAQAVQYVLVDRRLSQSLPASGTYFPGSSTTGNQPIPIADLTKFTQVPGVARVYDNGDIVIYNLQGARSAP
jgi:hypothetical protein